MPAASPSRVVPSNETPWLETLQSSRRLALLKAARRIKVGDRAAVYRLGDPPDGLYQVLSGHIRLISYPSAERQLVNLVAPPGAWFGELSTLDGDVRPHDAIAIGDVVLLRLPQRAIDHLTEADPGFYRDIALLACRHQRAALAYIGSMVGRSPRGRLAQTLLLMAEHSRSAHSEPLQLKISQEDLAGPVGLSRQSLNRHLQAFESEGLIRRRYGQIDLAEPDRLADLG